MHYPVPAISAKDFPADGILHMTGAPRSMYTPIPSKLNALRNDGRLKGGNARLWGEDALVKCTPMGLVMMGLLLLVLLVVVVLLVWLDRFMCVVLLV